MATSELRKRPQPAIDHPNKSDPATDIDIANPAFGPKIGHPSGEAKYGRYRSFLRAVTFSLYFGTGILTYVSLFMSYVALV